MIRALRPPRAARRAAAAGARFAAPRRATIPTTSTTRRRARWCARPRTRTSRGSIARAAARRDADRGDVSRARYIDPNRSLADIDPALLADAVAASPLAPSRKTRAGHRARLAGRARRRADVRAQAHASPKCGARIERCWRPYHAALDARARRAPSRVRRRLARQLPFDAGGRRRAMPTIRAASAPTSCSATATARPASRVHARSSPRRCAAWATRVAINDPYKGVEIVRKHGRPAERRHSLQIEIKRTLYMDEATLEPNAGYARLERDSTRSPRRSRRSCAPRAERARGRASGAATRNWSDHLTGSGARC